jgi:hypothetical protein
MVFVYNALGCMRRQICRLPFPTKPKDAAFMVASRTELPWALDEIERLRKVLGDLQHADAIGCCSGDCPHETVGGCERALSAELQEMACVARAALAGEQKTSDD